MLIAGNNFPAAPLTASAANDNVTARGYSGAPTALFTSAMTPKSLFNASGVIAEQNYLFRSQTQRTFLNLPDASGGDTGEGFTCTGLADGGTFWLVGSDGTNKETATPEVHLCGLVKVDKVSGLNVGEIRIDLLYGLGTNSTVQGVVIDPTDGTYWVGVGADGLKHISSAGVALSGSFVPAGGNANGVGLDTVRNYLLIFHYVSGTNSQLERYTRAGALIDTTTIPNTPTGDHVYYDALRDYYGFSYGANGTPGAIAWHKASDLSFVGTTGLSNAQAIEGFILVNGEIVACHDGYFHGWSSGALPKKNQLQWYPAVPGFANVAWPRAFDPVTHASLGYVFEDAYARLSGFPVSMESWAAPTGATRTLNTATAPDGTTSADTITATAGTSLAYINESFSVVAGSVTQFGYVRTDGYRYLEVLDRGTAPIAAASFDLQSKTLIGANSGVTGTIEDVGGNYAFVTMTYTRSTSGTSSIILNFGGAAHTSDYQSRTWAGTETLTFWGWQAAQKAFAPSPLLIHATASRAADSASLPVTNWDFSATANTFVISGRTARGNSGNQVALQIDDGSESNRYRLVRDASNVFRFIVTVGGVEQCNLNLGTVANRTIFKVAIRAKGGDFAASLNGGGVITSASGTLPTVTTVRPGMSFTGEWWNSAVEPISLAAADTANAALVALST
jgi:hypothetical protein